MVWDLQYTFFTKEPYSIKTKCNWIHYFVAFTNLMITVMFQSCIFIGVFIIITVTLERFTSVKKESVVSVLCPYKAIPFEIHTPPAEYFHKSSTEGVWFSNGLTFWAAPFEIHTPSVCATFWIYLLQRVDIFYMEVSRRLFHLKLILPVWKVYGKSSTGGVWIFDAIA